MQEKPKIIIVVGPTASGKSALAIEIAKQFSGEVISADSRQVYRTLDIGTAKLTKSEMAGVPHHLLDIVDVGEEYNATDFKRDAAVAIADITSHGNIPIIAGGTFFYIDTLLERISTPEVPPNPTLRAQLEEHTVETLFASLEKVDPLRASQIERQNKRRLIRALEIVAVLGAVPPSEKATTKSPYEALIIGITIEKDALRQSIAARAPDWLKNGFREEVQSLLQANKDPVLLQEIGFEYQLGIELIEGRLSEKDFIQKFTEKNWQYAKRQLTWLKRDKSIEWFAREDSEAIFTRVKAFLS